MTTYVPSDPPTHYARASVQLQLLERELAASKVPPTVDVMLRLVEANIALAQTPESVFRLAPDITYEQPESINPEMFK